MRWNDTEVVPYACGGTTRRSFPTPAVERHGGRSVRLRWNDTEVVPCEGGAAKTRSELRLCRSVHTFRVGNWKKNGDWRPRPNPRKVRYGGENGIRTHEGVLSPYSLSRRAPSADSAISPWSLFFKIPWVPAGSKTGIPDPALRMATGSVAEGVGFEPTEPLSSTVFKTAAFNHSAIPPRRGAEIPSCRDLVNSFVSTIDG